VHQIDLATFLTLTDQDLKDLGISTFGARRKMLTAIAGQLSAIVATLLREILVHGQVTIIFVVSVCLSVYLFVCLWRVFLSRL